MHTTVPITAALLAMALATTQTAPAQTYHKLYTFPAFTTGAQPMGSMLVAGNYIYGTTQIGGLAATDPYGLGTIYQFNIQTGRQTVLYSFQGQPSDGNYPYAGLVADAAGNLYGTTFFGGPHDLGVVFTLTAAGVYSVLHTFSGPDGAHPDSPLVLDAAGNIYGTTTAGGLRNSACQSPDGVNHSCGTVFRLDPSGHFNTVRVFRGTPDAANPLGALVLENGRLYGATSGGGAYNFGAVFALDGQTGEESVLYSFTGGADGKEPSTGVITDGNGHLYGGAVSGGVGNGVIYRIPIAGRTQTLLHVFTGADGTDPSALIFSPNGKLYGTAYNGAHGYGTVFELDPTSEGLTTLHSFQSGSDGAYPEGLSLDSSGNLYGTTVYGGKPNDGTIYRITP